MLNKLAKILIENNLVISTAESCTGGLISSMLTDISGSSAFIKANFVTYSEEAKQEILDVDKNIIVNFGVVSEECAEAMAIGLMQKTNCDIALCTTGIAGPTGGTKDKPVGLCYLSCKYKNQVHIKKLVLNSNIERKQMKKLFAENAINFVYEILSSN